MDSCRHARRPSWWPPGKVPRRHRALPAVAGAALALLVPMELQGQESPSLTSETFQGLEFRSLGPGLMSGRIADIAIHPEDPDVWYVGVGSGGVWKTDDHATTWTPIFEDQGSYSVGAVTLDPTNPDIVWVGTGENVSGRHVGYGDGVYRSLDGGGSWNHMGLRTSEHIGRILVDPRDSDVVLVAAEGPLWSAGGDRGVYRTEDGGDTWTRVLHVSDQTGATDLERDPRDPDVLYAATYQRRRRIWALLAGGPESGIHKSTDGGVTWREVTRGLPTGDMGKINLAVSPLDPKVIYATIEAGPEERGFYRSGDGGESWEKRSSYISGGTGPHYYQEIYASPHVFDRVYQMDVWMHVTDDGGRTFREVGAPNKHSDNHALAFVADDPDYLLAGTDGGLYETYDHAESWKFVSNLPVTQIYKMAVDDAEPFYNVIGGTQDNGTLYGPSRTASQHGVQNRDWIVPFGADGYATAIDRQDPNLLYVTWQNGHLLRYDLRTREPLDVQPQPDTTDPPERWNWDAPLELSPHDPARIYYGSQRLWRSDDRGSSWRPVSGDLTRNENRYELAMIDHAPGVSALYDNTAMSWYNTTTAVSESPLQEGLIYVGTDDGLIQVTEDGGESWRRVEGIPGIPQRTLVNDVQASVTDANTVFAVFDNHKEGDFAPYLMKSTDRGRSWSSISGDLPARHILWTVAQDHVDPDLLFVGSEFGVFFTPDGGRRWVKLDGGMPVIPVRDLALQRRESDLVASTFGRGFYVLDDYSPLRGVEAGALAADAVLFDVPDALRYVPSVDLGVRDKGYQGSAYFTAPNPPFGAVFTYRLESEAQTAREAREEREAELRDQGRDVPFPGYEALRAESREDDPRILLTVTDAAGDVVRRVLGPDAPGFHRVAWDLRYPSPDPVDLDPARVPVWANEPAGPLVAPGTYTVALARITEGRVRTLGEAREFQVRDFQEHTLAAGDPGEVLAFQRRTAQLQRRATSAVEVISEARDRLAHMEVAVLNTPGLDEELLSRVEGLTERFADLSLRLSGDPVRSGLREPSTPSIAGRIGQVVEGHWWTTEPPTETFRTSIDVAAVQLQALESDLGTAATDLRGLEEDLEAAGAPWTPGRRRGGSP